MKRTVLKYGLISGAVVSALMAVLLPLVMNGTIDPTNGQVLGYSTMVLAFIAVFAGVRSYRESHGGGAITFGQAFKVGILITLVTCAVYVIVWEITYWGFIPDFEDKYAAMTIGRMKAEGKSAAEIAQAEQQMAEFKRLYKNPLFNVGMTFMEIFPVGLLISLISAAILRKKPDGRLPSAAMA